MQRSGHVNHPMNQIFLSSSCVQNKKGRDITLYRDLLLHHPALFIAAKHIT